MGKDILENGTRKNDRTGTGTISRFGGQVRYDLSEGFPILTTKKVPFRVVIVELLWFIRGETGLKFLLDRNCNIWNGDAYRDYLEKGGELDYDSFIDKARVEDYDLGKIYSKQWRNWEDKDGNITDQLQGVIESIKENPDSRRHIVTAWNPGELKSMALPPCHTFFQFYVDDGKLSVKLFQRSSDFFLGQPFNITSYSLLLHMVAELTDLEVGEFVHSFGDAHIYLNHVHKVEKMMKREPRQLPKLVINDSGSYNTLEDFTEESFYLEGYNPHPGIKGAVSVGLESNKKKVEGDSPKIALTGKMRSGKDTVAEYLEVKYGMVPFAFGDALKRDFHATYPEIPRKPKPVRGYQLFGQLKRYTTNENVWVDHLLSRIDSMYTVAKGYALGDSFISFIPVITDVRQQNELDRLKEEGYHIIRVYCPDHMREERIEQEQDKLTGEESSFSTETDMEAFDVDYTIVNNGTLENLYKQVDETLELILENKKEEE